MTIALALLVALCQDDLDSDLERLSSKMSSQGVSGKLAAMMKTDAGRLVVKEAITGVATRVTARFDRDPIAYYERHFFAEDADGNLKLRADRRPQLDRLMREVARRTTALKDFDRKCADVAAKIVEKREIDKRAKRYWSDPTFRLGLYQFLSPEQRDIDAEELFNRDIGRALHRARDGKLRLRGSYVDEAMGVVATVQAETDAILPYDEGLGKVLEQLSPEERKRASSPAGRAILLYKLATYAGEGAEDPPKRMLTDDVEAKALKKTVADEIDALAKLVGELKPFTDRTVAELGETTENDRALKRILKEEMSLALTARYIRNNVADREAQREGAVNTFRDDHFVPDEAGNLTVRTGRFVNEAGEDAPDTLTAEYDSYIANYAALKAQFEEIAERALDPVIVELFDTAAGVGALNEHVAQVIAELRDDALDAAVRRFLRIYLVEEKGILSVRPERAARVEEMARRAEEVKKQLDEAAKEPAEGKK